MEIREPPKLAHFARRVLDDIFAVKEDFSAFDLPGFYQDAQDGVRRHGLARAGLADDPGKLAAIQVERHAVDGREPRPNQ